MMEDTPTEFGTAAIDGAGFLCGHELQYTFLSSSSLRRWSYREARTRTAKKPSTNKETPRNIGYVSLLQQTVIRIIADKQNL